MNTVKAKWYCSYYVGDYKWQSTEIYEPDECDTEFITEVSLEDWNDIWASAECPKCGATLWQYDGMGVLVDDLPTPSPS